MWRGRQYLDRTKACLYNYFWNTFEPAELISDHGTWQQLDKVCLSQSSQSSLSVKSQPPSVLFKGRELFECVWEVTSFDGVSRNFVKGCWSSSRSWEKVVSAQKT